MNVEDARRIVELSIPEYGKVRSEYWESIYTPIRTYLLEESKDETWFKSAVETAVQVAFAATLAQAWLDGGSKRKVSVSAISFIAANQIAEMGFLESLIYSLRLVKVPGEPYVLDPEEQPEEVVELLTEEAVEKIATERADGYARSLDRMYNNVKVMGAGNELLRFAGLHGEESCNHCQDYYGQVHPAWWWIKYDAVPPNRRFDCKGYKCLHVLNRLNGTLFTI